jgi:hypothetical protein
MQNCSAIWGLMNLALACQVFLIENQIGCYLDDSDIQDVQINRDYDFFEEFLIINSVGIVMVSYCVSLFLL